MLVGIVIYSDLSCKKIYQEVDYCETNFWTVTGGRITLAGWWLRAFYQNSHFLEAQPSAKNCPWILKFPFPWVAAVAIGCSFEFPPTGLRANFSLATAHIIGLTISMDEKTEAWTTSIITSIKERSMIRIIRCVNMRPNWEIFSPLSLPSKKATWFWPNQEMLWLMIAEAPAFQAINNISMARPIYPLPTNYLFTWGMSQAYKLFIG